MSCPEPSEAAQDTAYCEYLSGYSSSPEGFLLLLVGLEKVYEAMEGGEDEDRLLPEHVKA